MAAHRRTAAFRSSESAVSGVAALSLMAPGRVARATLGARSATSVTRGSTSSRWLWKPPMKVPNSGSTAVLVPRARAGNPVAAYLDRHKAVGGL